MQAFFQNFSKNFFGPAGGPKSTARTRHRQRPLSLTPNAGRLSSSRRKFRAVRPVPEPGIGSALFPHTANAGRSPFSRRKFRAVRPGPEPGIDSALFLPPQTRAAYLPLAESFAPLGAWRGPPGPQAQKNSRPIGRLLLVLANTYLPGPSPAKYFRHERA